MQFGEKLDYLLSVSGMSNSKLAQKIHVDASLVGKWRRGERRPSNQMVVDQVGIELAVYFRSDFMRRDLSMMANIPVAQLDGDRATQDAIATWLNAPSLPEEGAVQSHGHTQGHYSSRLLNEHLTVNHKGRVLVLKRMATQLEKETRLSCLRLFLDEPCEWLRIFAEHLDLVKANNRHGYDKFDCIRLLIPGNIGENEWQYISKVLYSYSDYANVTVAIPERGCCNNWAFQHSVMIAGGALAIISFGFYGSQNVISLDYENPTIIKALIADYDALFDRSSVVLQNCRDYTPLEEANKFSEMLDFGSDIYYCTYAIPPSLIPAHVMEHVIFRVNRMGLDAEKHYSVFCPNIARFLENNFLYTTFILCSPDDLKSDSLAFPHNGRDAPQGSVFTAGDYCEILKHTLALYRENPNLVIKLVEPDEMEYDLLVQEKNCLSMSKRMPREYTYTSTNHRLVAYAARWAQGYFKDASAGAVDREEVCSRLRRTIERFQEHPI